MACDDMGVSGDDRQETSEACSDNFADPAGPFDSGNPQSWWSMTARAQVVPRVEGRMNQTEKRYALRLEAYRRNGLVFRYDFEPVKLRLADNTFYTPDFRVILPDGTEEYHEVKGGYVREDAWIKLKLAAESHPYVFKMAQERRSVFTVTGI